MKKRACVFCGLTFSSPHKRRKFCSIWCAEMDRAVEHDKKKAERAKACVICGALFSVIPSRQDRAIYCSYACHQIGEGRKGGAVRGEQKQAESEGKTYTKIKGRHAHRVIAERMFGRPLQPEEVVHHIDGDHLNNDPSNLMILKNQAEHARVHGGAEKMLRARGISWTPTSSPEEAAHLSAV